MMMMSHQQQWNTTTATATNHSNRRYYHSAPLSPPFPLPRQPNQIEEEEDTTTTTTFGNNTGRKAFPPASCASPPSSTFSTTTMMTKPDRISTTTTTTSDETCSGNGDGGGGGKKKLKTVPTSFSSNDANDDEEDGGDATASDPTMMVPFSNNAAFTDALLSSRLNQVSLEDRNLALYDLHGVKEDNNEEFIRESSSPEFLKQKHHEMASILLNLVAELPPSETLAFRRAVSLNSEYVEEIKIMFLRAELYEPRKASERLLRHFTFKFELFDEDESMLVKDVSVNDLTSEERDILQQGLVTLLPHRDRAGRAVFMVHGRTNQSCLHNTTAAKAFFVFAMSVLRADIDTQRHGFVGIFYAIGQTSYHKGRFQLFVKMGFALPWRLVARHLCRESAGLFVSVLEYYIRKLPNTMITNFRMHIGTPMECRYKLMTFGLPNEAVDVLKEDGSIDLKHHHQILKTLQYRQQQQQQQSLHELHQQDPTSTNIPTAATSDVAGEGMRPRDDEENRTPTTQGNPCHDKHQNNIILVPNPMDVLMGKGHQPTKRPGLLRMHTFLEEHLEKYNNAPRLDKSKVCKLVLQEMHDAGSRFLTPLDVGGTAGSNEVRGGGGAAVVVGGYVECPESMAIEKIAHGFRNLRQKQQRLLKKKQQEQREVSTEGDDNASSSGSTNSSNSNKKKRALA